MAEEQARRQEHLDAAERIQEAAVALAMTDEPSTFVTELDLGARDD